MSWKRIAIVALLAAGIVPTIAEDEGDDPILRAYMGDADVAREIERLREDGYSDRGAQSTLISQVCGVAGCNEAYLVVHPFYYGGTNPQARSILARVGMFNAQIGEVKRVELAPVPPEPVPLRPVRGLQEPPPPAPQ